MKQKQRAAPKFKAKAVEEIKSQQLVAPDISGLVPAQEQETKICWCGKQGCGIGPMISCESPHIGGVLRDA